LSDVISIRYVVSSIWKHCFEVKGKNNAGLTQEVLYLKMSML